MFKVNIYLESSIKGPGKRSGWNAAVIEYIDKQGTAQTREDFSWEAETTYHRSILCALIKVLKRLNTSCSLTIYTDSIYIKNQVETNLERWKANGFLNAKKEPIKNREEWKEVAKLLSGQKFKIEVQKEHAYSVKMRKKAEELFE